MDYGFCNLALIPMRLEANNTSEQVSQLLFGETFDVLETFNDKCLIKTHHDFYQGWISQKQFLPITSADLEKLKAKPSVYCTKLLTFIEQKNLANGQSTTIPVTLGSTFCDYTYTIGDYTFTIAKTDAAEATFGDINHSIDIAKRFLNAPYLWGGRSILGIDCSGFTQLCYRFANIKLQRDAWQQSNEGSPVQNVQRAQAGDLCFFSKPNNIKTTHTGIYLGQGKIIHACSMVRIDRLTDDGITNIDTNELSHKLLQIKTWNYK
ncbi:MAG: C40 family peptidase [Bacteroidales bacterium]|jgi:hypothetical protein|nr:C40 family peptidase [Bacteroidales bacterium]